MKDTIRCAARLFAIFLLFAAAMRAQNPPITEYRLPPEKAQRADEYAGARHRLYFAGVAWGVIVLIAMLKGRYAPRLRDAAERATRRRILQAYLVGGAVLLSADLLSLPVDMAYHHLALKYDQSIQGWGSWLWDWAKGEAINLLVAGFLIWIVYATIRRSPRHWWFYAWTAMAPLIVVGVFVVPVLIDPLFFKFEPLAPKQPALVAEISKVVARGGLDIPRDRMFLMDASTKLKGLNAYVTGIGATKRVVVWDTTIDKLDPGGILFVFGHEMGHYVLNHIWTGIALSCAGLLLALWIGYRIVDLAVRRWGPDWSIAGLDDWASLPVLLLAMTAITFFAEPFGNAISRVQEHNADIYGLEVIRGIVPNATQEAAKSFQVMGEIGLSEENPSPFFEFWFGSHPSLPARVRFVAEYKGSKYIKP